MSIKTLFLKKVSVFWLVAIIVMLNSCGISNLNQSLEGLEPKYTNEEDIISSFQNGHDSNLFRIPSWTNGYPFNCRWSYESVEFDDGLMNISLFEEDGKYYGGEYQTKQKYSYGYFSVSMKPIKCDGVISSFFTYTNKPWDEIDIEFLGDDTTKVQFNYYTDGIGKHEYNYKLGFDASEELHEYGFYWTPESIVWYVDGKPVYKAVENIPSHSAQIMANVWNVHPDYKSWAGLFKGDSLPVTASYQWFAYSSHEE